MLGAVSLFLCVASMITILADLPQIANITFVIALTLMASSLACLIREIKMSDGALEILLNAMEKG